MKETTWIIDEATGALTIEGLSERELRAAIASDLLPAPARGAVTALERAGMLEEVSGQTWGKLYPTRPIMRVLED